MYIFLLQYNFVKNRFELLPDFSYFYLSTSFCIEYAVSSLSHKVIS